jgi:hypothetical protein
MVEEAGIFALREGPWKVILAGGNKLGELDNLSEDIGETRSFASGSHWPGEGHARKSRHDPRHRRRHPITRLIIAPRKWGGVSPDLARTVPH